AQRHERLRSAWWSAASACGLTVNEKAAPSDALAVRTATLAVTLDSYSGRDDRGTSVEIHGERGELSPYTLHAILSATSNEHRDHVTTGDAEFDAEVIVTGAEEAVRAVLDAETRGTLLSAVRRYGLGLGFGVIRAHISLASVDERRYVEVVL